MTEKQVKISENVKQRLSEYLLYCKRENNQHFVNNRNLILLTEENRKRPQMEKKNDSEHLDKRQRTTQNEQEDKGTNTSSLVTNKQREELNAMRHIETILNTKIEDMAAKIEYENHVQENRRKQLRKDRQLRNMIHDRLLN